MDLARSPELAADWVRIRPSYAVALTSINTRRTQLTDPDLTLLVEGATQTLDRFRWNVELNTTAADAWNVGRYAEDAGDLATDLARFAPGIDARGATPAAECASTARVDPSDTALSVVCPPGTSWTIDPDDYPLELDVAGRQVTATACTAPSGTVQTFTIDPVGHTLPDNSTVLLWSPRVPAL
jgi:hypothetical protein